LPEVYDNPKYYEIAFSFRDIPAEVDVLEECFKWFSKIPVKSVLELGCGNSPHMEELVKRGYQYSRGNSYHGKNRSIRFKCLKVGIACKFCISLSCGRMVWKNLSWQRG
jgi:hypothetical protein